MEEHEHRARTHGALTALRGWIDHHDALVEHQAAATRDSRVPNSTTPVEASPAEVKRRLADRAGVLTNLARMNKPLALTALDLRGQTDGRAWADRLRERTHLAGGHAAEQPHTTTPAAAPLTA
ncbi:MAG: hypothetical protein ACRDN8_14755 [Thermoleophilaceae bacterium]